VNWEVEHLVVVSPHLDDAALSLGSTIARVTSAGTKVTVLTVFAGDPDRDGPAGDWDARCGFSTAREAAVQRRAEDVDACAALGAEPQWLAFEDEQYAKDVDDAAITDRVVSAADGADAVLLPGHPLVKPDHVRVAALAAALRDRTQVGFYVEQPYASDLAIGRGNSLRPVLRATRLGLAARLRGGGAVAPSTPPLELPGSVDWRASRRSARDRRVKEDAIRRYPSQLGAGRLGGQVLTRIRLFEAATGGELIGTLKDG
jgi:LmbE family N-acetylglucosaminyl deacetylase